MTPGANILLTVTANSDFDSATASIPATAIAWTASGNVGFVGGNLANRTGQTLATFTGPGRHSGSQAYSMPNSWSYAPGDYAMTVTNGRRRRSRAGWRRLRQAGSTAVNSPYNAADTQDQRVRLWSFRAR